MGTTKWRGPLVAVTTLAMLAFSGCSGPEADSSADPEASDEDGSTGGGNGNGLAARDPLFQECSGELPPDQVADDTPATDGQTGSRAKICSVPENAPSDLVVLDAQVHLGPLAEAVEVCVTREPSGDKPVDPDPDKGQCAVTAGGPVQLRLIDHQGDVNAFVHQNGSTGASASEGSSVEGCITVYHDTAEVPPDHAGLAGCGNA